MLLFGHIGVTLGVFFVLGIFIPRLKSIINPKYLVIGALLPDLVDKPLGRVIFSSTLANGRIIGHTLLFSLTLLLIGLYLYKKREDIRIISLTVGSFFHLIEDQMWAIPKTLFWPFMGLNFPKNYTDYTGMEYLIRMIKNSFTFSLSYSSISEVLGMGVIVILILHWIIKRFGQSKI
ncbi:MAG: metal-dependent hydrolase [Methanosarcina sp.]